MVATAVECQAWAEWVIWTIKNATGCDITRHIATVNPSRATEGDFGFHFLYFIRGRTTEVPRESCARFEIEW